MTTYLVHVRCTEDLTFELEADSIEDAERRFQMDGREVFSSIHDIAIIETEVAPA